MIAYVLTVSYMKIFDVTQFGGDGNAVVSNCNIIGRACNHY